MSNGCTCELHCQITSVAHAGPHFIDFEFSLTPVCRLPPLRPAPSRDESPSSSEDSVSRDSCADSDHSVMSDLSWAIYAASIVSQQTWCSYASDIVRGRRRVRGPEVMEPWATVLAKGIHELARSPIQRNVSDWWHRRTVIPRLEWTNPPHINVQYLTDLLLGFGGPVAPAIS